MSLGHSLWGEEPRERKGSWKPRRRRAVVQSAEMETKGKRAIVQSAEMETKGEKGHGIVCRE